MISRRLLPQDYFIARLPGYARPIRIQQIAYEPTTKVLTLMGYPLRPDGTVGDRRAVARGSSLYTQLPMPERRHVRAYLRALGYDPR